MPLHKLAKSSKNSSDKSQETKCIFVDGVFDLFHQGHKNMILNAIKETKNIYPNAKIKVLIGICDEGVADYKRKTIMTLEERNSIIDKFMQTLVSNDNPISYGIIPNSPIIPCEDFAMDYGIDIFFHGNDFNEEDIKKYYGPIKHIAEVKTIPYTKGVSTTKLIVDLWRTGFFPQNAENNTGVPTPTLVERVQFRDLEDLGINFEKYQHCKTI